MITYYTFKVKKGTRFDKQTVKRSNVKQCCPHVDTNTNYTSKPGVSKSFKGYNSHPPQKICYLFILICHLVQNTWLLC